MSRWPRTDACASGSPSPDVQPACRLLSVRSSMGSWSRAMWRNRSSRRRLTTHTREVLSETHSQARDGHGMTSSDRSILSPKRRGLGVLRYRRCSAPLYRARRCLGVHSAMEGAVLFWSALFRPDPRGVPVLGAAAFPPIDIFALVVVGPKWRDLFGELGSRMAWYSQRP